MKKMTVKDNPKRMKGNQPQKQDQAESKVEDLYRFLEESYGFSRKEMFAESEED